MDLRFTPEENTFRAEVRAFIKANLPDHIRAKAAEGMRYIKDDIVAWQRILNKQGWAVPHWPKEYGGTGWSPVRPATTRTSCGPPSSSRRAVSWRFRRQPTRVSAATPHRRCSAAARSSIPTATWLRIRPSWCRPASARC